MSEFQKGRVVFHRTMVHWGSGTVLREKEGRLRVRFLKLDELVWCRPYELQLSRPRKEKKARLRKMLQEMLKLKGHHAPTIH